MSLGHSPNDVNTYKPAVLIRNMKPNDSITCLQRRACYVNGKFNPQLYRYFALNYPEDAHIVIMNIESLRMHHEMEDDPLQIEELKKSISRLDSELEGCRQMFENYICPRHRQRLCQQCVKPRMAKIYKGSEAALRSYLETQSARLRSSGHNDPITWPEKLQVSVML